MTKTAVKRPGWAVLPDNYSETVERGASFAGTNTTSFELGQILAHACGTLSDQEMRLLHFYLADMNLDQIRSGEPHCWKSSDFIQTSLCWSKSKVSRVKASLRDKGFITVHYDIRNRPLEGVGISLSPFFAQIDKKRASVKAAFQERRDRFTRLKSEASLDVEDGTKGPDLTPIIQTPQTCLNTVPAETNNEINTTSTPPRTHHRANWSSGKNQRDFHQPRRQPSAPTELNEHLKKRISDLTSLSPTVTSLVGTKLNTAQNSDTYFEIFKDVCGTVWPDRNTAGHTWHWAFQRYSWTAVELLIVALEDPDIRDGQRWFGHMSTRQSETFSLKPNLARIRAKRDQHQKRPTQLSPTSRVVFECVGADAWHCWFTDISISNDGGSLVFTTNSEFKRERLTSKFGQMLQRASEILKLKSVKIV